MIPRVVTCRVCQCDGMGRCWVVVCWALLQFAGGACCSLLLSLRDVLCLECEARVEDLRFGEGFMRGIYKEISQNHPHRIP